MKFLILSLLSLAFLIAVSFIFYMSKTRPWITSDDIIKLSNRDSNIQQLAPLPGDKESFENSTQHIISALDLVTYKYLIPLCLGSSSKKNNSGKHWILVYLEENNAWYFDPLGVQSVSKPLNETLSKLGADILCSQNKFQKDHFNCGRWVLMAMKAIQSNSEKNFTELVEAATEELKLVNGKDFDAIDKQLKCLPT